MPAPTNVSALTATELGAFPASVSQNVHDAGTTYTVWYTFEATAAGVAGVFGFGDLVDYSPTTTVWIGPASSPTLYLNLAGDNRPVQFPVASGTRYYLKFETNAGNPSPAVLLLEAEYFQEQTVPVGAILDPDDAVGFPAAILDPLTGLPLRFILGFPAGESAFALDNGYILTQDLGGNQMQIWGPTLEWVADVAVDLPLEGGQISGNKIDRFYVTNPTASVGPHIPAFSVGTFGIDGSPGPQTWTLGAGAYAICPSPDESILYYGDIDAGDPIKRWDLVNDTGLSDLTAAPTAFHRRERQMLCLNDGTILALWTRLTGPECKVYRYNPDGSVENIYDLSADVDTTFLGANQVAHALDDPDSFWVWLKVNPQGFSRFLHIRTSDGVIISQTPDVVQYEVGAYFAAATATPAARFGHSESCPFLILPIASDVGGGGGDAGVIGPLVWVHMTRRT